MPDPANQPQAAALVRRGGPQRAILLELLFDLVFVAAIALSSTTLAGDVSWHGVVRVVLPLAAVWWVWSITALLTDFYDPHRPRIQLVIVSAMLGSMMLAASVPEALGGRALVFAGTYVAVHIGRRIILVGSLGGTAAQVRAARFAIWFAVSGVAWLVGRVSWTRFAFMGVLVGLSPVLRLLPPFLVAIAVASVLAGIAVTDTVRANLTLRHAPQADEPSAQP